jgi:putative membrane protein
MQIFLIIALLISIIAVVFALQNLAAVTVSFFIWSIHGSLALVLLVSVAAGVLISLLASLPGLIRARWAVSAQRKKLAALETESSGYKKRADAAEQEVKTLEEQLAALAAAYVEHPSGQASLPAAGVEPASPTGSA